jgi:hypothetical protein
VGLLGKAVRLASKNSGKIKKLAEDNADKITDTVGKVTDKVDKQTQGKHRDKLDKLEGAVDKALKKDDGPEQGGTNRPG